MEVADVKNPLNITNVSIKLQNLNDSIYKGKFHDVMSNYMKLKSQEYSLILREVETPYENLNENDFDKNNHKDPLKLEIAPHVLSDQIKVIKTKNKLKKFKSNHDKLLTDLILRKHSSSRSLNFSHIKKSDSIYSSDLFVSLENKTSFETAKDSPHSEIYSSLFINSDKNDHIPKINIYEPFQQKNESEKVKEKIDFDGYSSNDETPDEFITEVQKEKVVNKDITHAIRTQTTTNSKNLLNNLINVKIKIFQPNFE
jgi:hypothetical protein